MSELHVLLDETVGAMETLAALLERETGLVRTVDFAELGQLQAEKARLARLYEERLQALGDAAGEAGLGQAGRTRLQAAGAKLTEAAGANMKAIAVARHASTRVVDLILETARQATRATPVYDKAGVRNDGLGTRAVSFRLDARL